MNWGIVVCMCIVAAIVITMAQYIRNKKRERIKIIESIGEIPEPKSAACAEAWWKTYKDKQKVVEKVDDHTWQNLDMDDVYQRLNACWCEAGDILLYKRLRSFADDEEIARQENLVHYFKDKPEALYRLIGSIKHIGRGHYHTVKTLTLAPEELDSRWKGVAVALAVLPLCSVFGCFISPMVFLVLLAGSLAVNFIATYILKAKILSYQVVYPFSNLLYWSKKIASEVQECVPETARRMNACLVSCEKINMPAAFMRFSDFCQQMGLPDISGVFLIPILSYFYLIYSIQKQVENIAELYLLVGEVDAACAVYSFRKSFPYWALPEYIEGRRLTAKGLYHPLLGAPVANSIDTNQCVLLTGSNASGKSTFIKSVALNLIMAQAINTCCALSLCLKRSNVLTAMAVSDSIVDGDSYFMAEIKAMKRLVDATDGAHFSYLFIDEILRGTNTIERIAAAHSFLEYFNTSNVLCFAASHDIELVAMTSPGYAQYHFAESFEDGEILFKYRMQKGPSNTRNAVQLLKAQGFPPSITKRAEGKIQRFETEGTWGSS